MKKKAKKIFSILMVVGMLFQTLAPTMVYAVTYHDCYEVWIGGTPTINGSTFEYTNGDVTITKNGIPVNTTSFGVDQGDDIIITLVPDEGYIAKLQNAFNGSDITLDENKYSFTIRNVVASRLTLNPSFESIPATTHGVTKIESNGTFAVDKTSATSGETITLSSITPSTGYQLKEIKILKASDNSDITSAVNYNSTNKTFTMPDYEVNVSVEFEKIQYTIVVSPVENASITPNGTINVEYGDNKEITITANTGYRLKSVKLDGVEQTLPLTNNKITLTNIQKDITIIVECESIPATTHGVTKIESNGTFAVDKTSATSGETITLSSITPSTGYQLKEIKILKASDNSDITSAVNYNSTNKTFTMPDYEVNVSVEFEKIQYTIVVSPVENASITPNAPINVEYGDNKEITITANTGYRLKSVKVDGVEQTLPLTNNKITLTNIQKDITIIVECELLYEEKTITKTEEDITVIVKGQFNGNPTLVITSTEAGNEGYNSLITLVKDDEVVFGSYDVSITGGTYKGELAITFTIGKQYEGDTITIYHKLANGEIETKTTTVKDGKIIITVDELSPFMLITDKEIVEQKDETPKTGDNIYIYTTLFVIVMVGMVSTIIIKKRKFDLKH